MTPNQTAAHELMLSTLLAGAALGICKEDMAAAMLAAFTNLVMDSPERHEAADGLIKVALAMKSRNSTRN
ncbi:hypothetical protein [Rhizobium sp.]